MYLESARVVPVDLRAVFSVGWHPHEAAVFAQICGMQFVLEQVQVLQKYGTGGHIRDNVLVHGATCILQRFLHIRCATRPMNIATAISLRLERGRSVVHRTVAARR